MADKFLRTYNFVDGTTAYGSQVEAEIGNIVDVLNDLNTAAVTWDRVSISHATSVPLIADCASGSQNIAEFKNNNVTKASISSAGAITAVGGTLSAALVMGSNKITGLTAGTAVGEAVSYAQSGQVLQVIKGTAATLATSTSATYADTGLSATITPKVSTSTIYIYVSIPGGTHIAAGQTTVMDMKILRGAATLVGAIHGEVLGQGSATMPANDIWGTVCLLESDAPGVTSATTYKVQFARPAAAGSVYVMDASFTQGTAVMLLVEVA